MTTHLLDEALKVIPNQPVLINVVSKRVRQLGQGHRPMVEVGARIDYADIALREIIEGKLQWEALVEEDADTVLS
jgi:DNA-directed RNA polymerase subunit omega